MVANELAALRWQADLSGVYPAFRHIVSAQMNRDTWDELGD